MKILSPIALCFLSLVLLSASCNKRGVAPQSELSKLPAATQTGANTFGCLVNGKAFLPNGNIFAGPALQCNYINLNGGNYFLISASSKSYPIVYAVAVRTDSLTISQGQTTQLTGYNIEGEADGDYSIFNPPAYIYSYYTNKTVTGQLTITKLDPAKQILSGTFSFTAVDASRGDTVKVTDGRFDMYYTK
jgi:hypothetical protein